MTDYAMCEFDGCAPVTKRGQRFATEKCRQAWHRTHSPRGTVRSVRKLSRGGTAVVVHFAEAEAEAALRLQLKQAVFIGRAGRDDGDALHDVLNSAVTAAIRAATEYHLGDDDEELQLRLGERP